MIVPSESHHGEKKLALSLYNKGSDGEVPNLEKSDVEYIDVAQSEPLKNECRHFIDVVNGRLMPLTDGDEGLRVLNVLSTATLSQNENDAVRVESL